MTPEQQRLMRRICANRFAMWELKIFLDTHPNNTEAMKRLEQYAKETQTLVDQYEDAYGTLHLTDVTTNRWAWVQEPWPWEMPEDKAAAAKEADS